MTSFEYTVDGRELGCIRSAFEQRLDGQLYTQLFYDLVRCTSCGRGGVAVVSGNQGYAQGDLARF